MRSAAAAEHLAHAASLERRDAAVAAELDVVRGLAQRTGALRARAAEVRDALEALPVEVAELQGRRGETEAAIAAARAELDAAEARVERLERARRAKSDELDRARSEAATARAQLDDTEAQLGRLAELETELQEREVALRGEAVTLARDAATVASEIRDVGRVTASAGGEPGEALDELEEWGAQARSALFVAQGTLETERERIVVEANALGTAVLGESLGASSVAVVRRRLEERLG